MRRLRERGAALLIAMLTVALVATFAAAALWQQWRSIEVETAERSRVQSGWILTGALDWARLLLREDARPNGSTVDHLGEPWAVPLQEARLSSFLAADQKNNADVGPDVLEAFLSGQIIDLQSMLNVTSLAVNGRISDNDMLAFAKLFDMLGLPKNQLDILVENMRFASDLSASNRSSAVAPLQPQRVEQLVWLGLSPHTVAVLQPYVTLLPSATKVNVNTASAEVIYAAIPVLSLAQAQQLVTIRESAPIRKFEDIANALGLEPGAIPPGQVQVGVSSSFFEVRARLRLDGLVVEERSVLQRPERSFDVTVWQRERGIVDPTALSRIAAGR
ncbi:MAG TPA: type II secretion system minor pseudopilin GspK [Ramlibacter sp.]|nr:type II secretion system minor pseudopilin GspK [Ramlibacter sp.]